MRLSISFPTPLRLTGIVFIFLTASWLPGQPRPETPGVEAHRDVAYVSDGHPRQTLDLYVPTEGDGPWPVVIWIHGGAWLSGSKDNCPLLRGGYVQRGYAVASLNYRLSQDAPFPAQIQDCKAALRWLRAHAADYHLDVDHFGVIGSSAGGHLAALVGTSAGVPDFDVGENLDQSSAVQAAGDYFGPTDFRQMDRHAHKTAKLKHDAPDSPEAKLLGGPIQEHAQRTQVEAANPISYIDAQDPPFLIVHGDADPTVPYHQSKLLHRALKRAKVPTHFITVQGGGHGRGFPGAALDPVVGAFFDRHLRGDLTVADWPAVKTSQVQALATAPVQRPRAGNGAPSNRTGNVPNWDAMLRRQDQDHDGRLSRSEFRGADRLWERLDTDEDGFLTEAEHLAALARRRRN